MWLIKKQIELDTLRKNWEIHKIVFEEIKKMSQVWVTWYDIDKKVWEICKKYNVFAWFKWVYNFPANLCISINDVVAHWVPNKKYKFRSWDIVKYDFWVKDKDIMINTDAAFTSVIWWTSDKKIQSFIDTNKRALYKWIDKAISGNKVWDISAAIQKEVESNGFHIVKDLTWHWLWYKVHEKPYIYNYWKAWTWEILKKWMILAIEPITWFSTWKIKHYEWEFEIYMADWWAWAQFEHTIVVWDDKAEIIV